MDKMKMTVEEAIMHWAEQVETADALNNLGHIEDLIWSGVSLDDYRDEDSPVARLIMAVHGEREALARVREAVNGLRGDPQPAPKLRLV